jgi:N-methylhydantoinase A/oxoprolinase/acetone carboxylase beta subunit
MYYVGVDIGGTFTDCVLVDRQGNHRSAKVLPPGTIRWPGCSPG